MVAIKGFIKVFISIFTVLIIIFSLTEIDYDVLLEDPYEWVTFTIFLTGLVSGTTLLWLKERLGSAILVLMIIFEFVVFMVVDGELMENLSFLLLAIPPLVVFQMSAKQDDNNDEYEIYNP